MEFLVVVRPFGPYRVGDIVTDTDVVARILESEHAEHVVRVTPTGKE